MIKTATNHTRMLMSLAGLYQTFVQNKDEENSNKMKQLIKKAEEHEVQLAFCGHFSAGKSSMINYLMGSQILPSSPVPTSANIVKVKQGKEAVKVHFFDGTYTVFEGSHDMKDIKAYCKEGEQIRAIDIYSDHFPLPKDCAVLDTPGIDSTDDAHRVSTESTLHLADIVLYVMDYNHVQSQENFLFAKKMNEAGKKLYLIINQIDKHDESELSFGQFKDSVANAFAQWNISPEGIFYTSLRNFEIEDNEIEVVKQFIHEKIAFEREHLQKSIITSAKQLANDHIHFLQEEYAEEIDHAHTTLSQYKDDELSEIMKKLEEYTLSKQQMLSFPETFYLKRTDDLDELLKNAYLLSAESRDLIKSYLESQQEQFKVGLLFSKNKTEAEKAAREQALMSELENRTKTQLEWHIKEFASQSVKQAGVSDSSLEFLAQEMSISFTKDDIKNIISKQSDISGKYVLIFSEKVSDFIKNIAKKQMLEFLQSLKEAIKIDQDERLSNLEKETEEIRQVGEAQSLLQKVAKDREERQMKLEAILSLEKEQDEAKYTTILSQIHQDEKNKQITVEMKKTIELNDSKDFIVNDDQNVTITELEGKDGLEKWSKKLQTSAELLKEVNGFTSVVQELKEKAERMQNQTYTIALFGAFSAGKSSFANALFGEKVLPVSPNPTTAVINKVMAPGASQEHRTAKIQLKTAEMLLEDVKIACKALNFSPDSLEDAYRFGENVQEKATTVVGKEKAHLSFILAFYKGYESLKNQLGQSFIVEYEEFTQFAADESKSCFVDEISLYFDCELTRKGIVLVDTPGADSINARHTNAAFHYIKNSDAILFVTYYNHPFAKADREFLIQLGRVKDSFSMDKMFFICNAIDLAQNEDELLEVTTYIKGQLEGFGIRFPRLFPLSSKEALNEQKEDYLFKHTFLQDSGMKNFQQAFSYFIQHELVDLSCTSAQAAIQRALSLLREIIAAATSSSEEKKERLLQLQKEYKELKDQIGNSAFTVEEQRMNKEADELLHYIHQRVFLRFADFFKESFNPAVIKDDGRDLKGALKKALRELLDAVGFDFEQEMRATSLRLDRFLRSVVLDKKQFFGKLISKTWNSVEIGDYSIGQYEVPEYNKTFQEMDSQDFKKELSLFKNTKSFFEKNDKQKMAEGLQTALKTPAQVYLNAEGATAKQYYGKLLLDELDRMKKHVEKELDDVYESYISVLQENVDVDYYKEKEQSLQQMF
ncbi:MULTISPECIES: dynamin family protein [Bacillus]|uniref:dynamin family protein n=1 Tax=Bacillus TaxID=1386 RepID=UPI0003100CF0|nr:MULTISPECIES: dynamin family protein [Bacillus]